MEVKQALYNSVEEVLDKMAFMYFEDLEDEPPEDSYFDSITQVGFNGMINGTVNIMMTKPIAEIIGRNLLGIREDDELYGDTLLDALREFTNLVMGRTMTILNPHGPFDMTVPAIVEIRQTPSPDEVVLTVDGALDDVPIRISMNYKENPDWRSE